MDYKHLLFSFNGRIRRLHYWLGALGNGIVGCVLIGIIMMVFGGAGAMLGRNGGGAGAAGGGLAIVGLLLSLVVYAAMVWVSLALMFKRIHDRDRSAVFLLLLLVPLLNLWPAIEILFLDGTPGPNKFGPSPKGLGGEAAPAAVA